MLDKIFQIRKNTPIQLDKTPQQKYQNSHIALDGKSILARQAAKIEDITNSLSVSESIFKLYYEPLFINICELAQCVPASESDHHSNLHGYLDHTFECVVLALRKSEGVIYGSDREDKIMQKKDIFSYAVTVGAITHDLGKLITDIQFFDHTNNKPHYTLLGPIKPGNEFIYRFYPHRNYADHKAAGISAIMQIIPAIGIQWLHSDDVLFRQLVHTINGDYKLAGKLGDIIREADQYSTEKNLRRTATKFASKLTQEKPNTSIDRELGLQEAQQEQSNNNQHNRASEIAKVIVEIIHTHYDLSNGKNINEKGGFIWVTRDYIYMATPRCFEIIKSKLEGSRSGIRLTMAHVCYQILYDGGFVEKVNGQTSDFLTIDPDDWKKTLRFVKLKRKMFDPEFKLAEAGVKIINPKAKNNGEDLPKVASKGADTAENQYHEQQGVIDSSAINQTQKTQSIDVTNMAMNSETARTDLTPTNQEEVNHSPASTDINEKSLNTLINEPGNNENISQLLQSNSKRAEPVKTTKKPEQLNEVAQLFIAYLKDGFEKKSFNINKTNAQVHVVKNTLFLLSPNIFNNFIESSFGQIALTHTKASADSKIKAKRNAVQHKLFECKLHYRDSLNLKNILSANVVGMSSRSNIHGVLLQKSILKSITADTFKNSKNVFLTSIVQELKYD